MLAEVAISTNEALCIEAGFCSTVPILMENKLQVLI